LFDQDDMDKIARPRCIDIRRALRLKLRAAAESGTPYSPLPPCAGAAPRQVIVVEGPSDAAIITALLQSRRAGLSDAPPPVIVVAMGMLNLPLVALAQLSLHPSARQIIIVVDGDGDPDGTRQRIEERLRSAAVPPDVEILTIVLDPTLGAALSLTRRGMRPEQFAYTLAQADISRLSVGDTDLRRLFDALGLI
jgi:5S rRNA maturation endonuclease (ribonuclease M5)